MRQLDRYLKIDGSDIQQLTYTIQDLRGCKPMDTEVIVDATILLRVSQDVF
jgi:hypothetical protein